MLLALLAASILLAIFVLYIIHAYKAFILKRIVLIRIRISKERKAFALKRDINKLGTFIFLSFLFVFLLIPAIVQVHLELRWLQAPLCVVILMVVIAFTSLPIRNNVVKKSFYTLFIILFLLSDYNYLLRGASNLYYSLSARATSVFNDAINNGTIHQNTAKLYVWEKHRNPDRENEINWALAGGYFFQYYMHKDVNIVYVDTLYQRQDSLHRSTFIDFNKNTDQVLLLNITNYHESFNYSLNDITGEYLKDSLRTFVKTQQ
jgi:hypothetical protein